MYRIMIVKSKRDNSASLYQWLTEELSVGEGDETTVEVKPVEFLTEEEPLTQKLNPCSMMKDIQSQILLLLNILITQSMQQILIFKRIIYEV